MTTKIIFTALIIFNTYLFATIGDEARADLAYQAGQIPARIGQVIETVGVAIQERANQGMEVSSL